MKCKSKRTSLDVSGDPGRPKYSDDRGMWAVLEVVSGVEGPCLALNDYRIAGPKPWGGGTVTHRWIVSRADLKSAINLAFGKDGK